MDKQQYREHLRDVADRLIKERQIPYPDDSRGGWEDRVYQLEWLVNSLRNQLDLGSWLSWTEQDALAATLACAAGRITPEQAQAVVNDRAMPLPEDLEQYREKAIRRGMKAAGLEVEPYFLDSRIGGYGPLESRD